MNRHLAIKMPCFSTIAPALGRFESVVGRALPAFTINVDGISMGSAHPTKLTQAVHPRLIQRLLKNLTFNSFFTTIHCDNINT